MTDVDQAHELGRNETDVAPGEEHPQEQLADGLLGDATGLALAILLTIASFALVRAKFVWGPAIPIALIVLAIAQMGVHLVFFLHITTGPDNTNNVLALAFGVLFVLLLIGGSIWIMSHMNANMEMGLWPTHGAPSG